MDSKEHRVVVVLGYKYEEIDDLFCIFEKDLEINLFETPTKDGKDKVTQYGKVYVHQYTLSSNYSRIEEILRDMIAIHAELYIISTNCIYAKQTTEVLTKYGFRVMTI